MARTVNRKVTIVALVSLMSVLMSAVAGAVTLRVTLYNNEPRVLNGTLELMKEFTEQTGIEVELAYTYGTDFDRLAVEIISGVAADVILTWNHIPELAIRNNLFLNLAPYIERDGRHDILEDFIPGTMAIMTRDGGIYGFPFYSSSGAMYLNADMFDLSGVALPQRGWDWDDFAQLARRMTRRDGEGNTEIHGAHSTMGWLNVLPWLWQAGAEQHPAGDLGTVTMDTPETVFALEYLQDLVREDVMTWEFRRYHYGQAAMSPSGSWEFQFLGDSFPIAITSLPEGPAGRANFTNTDILSINAQTKHPEEAWKFLEWFYSIEVQEKYMYLRGNQPARMSLGYQWIESVYEANPTKQISGLEAFIEDAMIARPQPYFTDPTVINEHIMPAIRAIVLEGAPAGPILEEMSRVATAALP